MIATMPPRIDAAVYDAFAMPLFDARVDAFAMLICRGEDAQRAMMMSARCCCAHFCECVEHERRRVLAGSVGDYGAQRSDGRRR